MSHLSRLTTALTASGHDAILLTSAVSQRWTSGFDYTDGYIFVTRSPRLSTRGFSLH